MWVKVGSALAKGPFIYYVSIIFGPFWISLENFGHYSTLLTLFGHFWTLFGYFLDTFWTLFGLFDPLLPPLKVLT